MSQTTSTASCSFSSKLHATEASLKVYEKKEKSLLTSSGVGTEADFDQQLQPYHKE